MYEYFRVTGANDSVENDADLFTICLRNDDIQEFDSKWDGNLLSMTKIPSDDILEVDGPRTSGGVGRLTGGTAEDGPRVPRQPAGGTTEDGPRVPRQHGILSSSRIPIAGQLLSLQPRKWDTTEPPSFLGFTANYLMWRNAVLRWKRTHGSSGGEAVPQGHEHSGLDGTGLCGREALHRSPSAAQRCGVDFEGLGRQGRLDPGRRIQASLAKGTLQRGERQGRVPAAVHNKEVGADRGSLCGSSRRHANGHLVHNLEGRRAAVKAVRTEPQYTLEGSTELDVVARALDMLDVDAQEGITKAAVKPVVHSFMETGGDQHCNEEKEEH